jgi:hypothetical protein
MSTSGKNIPFDNIEKIPWLLETHITLCLNYSRITKKCIKKTNKKAPLLNEHYFISTASYPGAQYSGGGQDNTNKLCFLGMTKSLINSINKYNGSYTILENGIGQLWNLTNLKKKNSNIEKISNYPKNIKNMVQSTVVRTRNDTSGDVYPKWSYWPYKKSNYLTKKTIPPKEIFKKYVILIVRTFPRSRSTHKPELLITSLKEIIKPFNLLILNETNSNDRAVYYFENASAVIGSHGGMLMHIRACKPGTPVIEIQPKNGALSWIPKLMLGIKSKKRLMYSSLGIGLNLKYYLYYADKFPKSYHDTGKNGIIYLNISHFSNYVSFVLRNIITL